MRGGLLFENWHGLFLTDIVQHEFEQFEDCITVGIELEIFGNFLETRVDRCNEVARTNHFTNFWRVVKKGAQAGPVTPPGLANWGKLDVPFSLKLDEPASVLVLGRRCVN